MIKIFRKIRYDLMGENKTGKYLKYAIGEIILVVIGILIALQINNWNEMKKSNKQLNDFLILMLDELSQDSEFLTGGLFRADRNIKFLTAISKGNYSDVSIENFPMIIGNSMASKKFGTTYNNIKSDGKFNLIENIELKKRINSYYEDKTYVYNSWSSWNQKFVSDHIEGDIMHDLPIKVGYKTDSEFLIEEFKKGKYLSMVNYQLTFLSDFREKSIEIIETNQALITLIKTELNN